MKIKEIMETASDGATSAGNIATIVTPGGISKKKPKLQKHTDNALDMKNISIFGGPLKRI